MYGKNIVAIFIIDYINGWFIYFYNCGFYYFKGLLQWELRITFMAFVFTMCIENVTISSCFESELTSSRIYILSSGVSSIIIYRIDFVRNACNSINYEHGYKLFFFSNFYKIYSSTYTIYNNSLTTNNPCKRLTV